jgi:hypothetical protein
MRDQVAQFMAEEPGEFVFAAHKRRHLPRNVDPSSRRPEGLHFRPVVWV